MNDQNQQNTIHNRQGKCENDLNDPNADECFNAEKPKPNEVKDLQIKQNLLRPHITRSYQ